MTMATGAPLASVVICAHNEEAYISESIESMLGQTFTRFELVIVDDASTDRTLDLIRKYSDPRIRLIKNGKNLGIAASRNLGIAAAKASVIVVADADDTFLPSRIEEQLRYLDKNPEVGAVGTYVHVIDDEGERLGVIKTPIGDLQIKNEMKRRPSLLHCALAIRKDLVVKSGGYRDKFIAGSDYDLLLRLSEQTKMATIPISLSCYRVTPKSISIRDREVQRFCIDLAKRFARERSQSGRDNYEEFQINELKRRAEPQNENAARARYHLHVGKLAGAAGKMTLARRHYLRSLLRNPIQLGAWFLLATAMAGKNTYQGIQRRFGTTEIEPQ